MLLWLFKLFSSFSDKKKTKQNKIYSASWALAPRPRRLKDRLYIGRIQVHATHTETRKAL